MQLANKAQGSYLIRLLLIDLPPHIEGELTDLVMSMWGLQNREVKEEGASLTTELKMKGTPWNLGGWFSSAGERGVSLRQLLMEMIRVMRRYFFNYNHMYFTR